ncbi:MAG TPA: D-2-hydroxyacid dehydrogenase family protein [Candidatus Eisenbacteria bacterium]|nr:D-2-hydroxyacid dehydrogenase family protein [Candidatus Eisenbacteria bacterium]
MSANPFQVVILDDFERLAATVPAYEQLSAKADVAVLNERLDTSEKIVERLRDADAILLMRERTWLSDTEYGRLPKLKFISQTGRTSRHLDLAAATRRGIAVAGTPADDGTSTKELTIGLIIALLRQIPQVDRRMREEIWPPLAGRLLKGKTTGVLGFGRIGMEVARLLKAFDARVLAFSRTLTNARAAAVGAERVPLETLLKESDVLTIHVPFNAETRALIGERELALMKPGAMLVNTARGPIVSEPALIEALRRGRLGGAALDVFDTEPLPLDHPLRSLSNVILLSHRGYATIEVLRERYQEAMENILSFIEGDLPPLLNPEVETRARKG